jgi:hypothetical protein
MYRTVKIETVVRQIHSDTIMVPWAARSLLVAPAVVVTTVLVESSDVDCTPGVDVCWLMLGVAADEPQFPTAVANLTVAVPVSAALAAVHCEPSSKRANRTVLDPVTATDEMHESVTSEPLGLP